jgi:hypothetical protein
MIVEEKRHQFFGDIIDGVRRKLPLHKSKIIIFKKLKLFKNYYYFLNDSSVIFFGNDCEKKFVSDPEIGSSSEEDYIPFKRNLLKANDMNFITYVSCKLEATEKSRISLKKSEILIYDTKNELQLLTNEFHVDGRCVENFWTLENYLKLNTFDLKKSKWNNELKYFTKHENFQKCPIEVNPIKNFYEISINRLTGNYQSAAFDIMNILAEIKNFSIKNGEFYTAPFDLSVSVGECTMLSEYVDYAMTLPFDNDEIFFMITPGELYSDYEKLLLPFDFTTWLFLLITFGCAFLVIFIINLMPKVVHDTVFGAKIQSPAFNLIGKFWLLEKSLEPK